MTNATMGETTRRKVYYIRSISFWIELCMIYDRGKKTAGIYLIQTVKYLNYLIKVRYDLIEQAETLQSFLIDIGLGVKLFKVWDGGEHHTHRLVRLVIKVLITSNGKLTAGCIVAGDRRNAKVRVWVWLEKIYELNGDAESKNTFKWKFNHLCEGENHSREKVIGFREWNRCKNRGN